VVDGSELQQVVVDRVMFRWIRVAIDCLAYAVEAEVDGVPVSLRALDAITAGTLDEMIIIRTVRRAAVAGLAIADARQHTRNMVPARSLVYDSAAPLKEC
jgi:hypothetical protein